MSRYLPDDRLQDRPGAIYEIEGRQVKVVACRHGYALYLLDSAGQPGLPIPTGSAGTLTESLEIARRFFRKLDKDPLAAAKPHGLCRHVPYCVEQLHNRTVPSCKRPE